MYGWSQTWTRKKIWQQGVKLTFFTTPHTEESFYNLHVGRYRILLRRECVRLSFFTKYVRYYYGSFQKNTNSEDWSGFQAISRVVRQNLGVETCPYLILMIHNRWKRGLWESQQVWRGWEWKWEEKERASIEKKVKSIILKTFLTKLKNHFWKLGKYCILNSSHLKVWYNT